MLQSNNTTTAAVNNYLNSSNQTTNGTGGGKKDNNLNNNLNNSKHVKVVIRTRPTSSFAQELIQFGLDKQVCMHLSLRYLFLSL